MGSMANAIRQPVYVLPLWAAIVPFATINISYLMAMSLEHVPVCLTYLSGCTSVSSTGRTLPESLIFRAGMLSSAVILGLMWYRCATFLQLGGRAVARTNLLRLFGFLAAVSLATYAVTLGLREDEYRFIRRIGINGFALSNVVTQVIFIGLYKPMRIEATRVLYRWLIVLCVILPLLGFATELAKWLGVPRHQANNTVAWNAFLVVSVFYAIVARIWWLHDFSSEFSSKSAGRAASPRE